MPPGQLQNEIAWTKAMVQRLSRELDAQRKALVIQQREATR